jgi:16S rRNA (cytosine1402-N4)-methyltransferase
MHQNKNQNKNKQHVPVLVSEVINCLEPKPGESYLDLTAGYGGHAQVITELTGSLTRTVLVDRDQNAIQELSKIFPASIVQLRQQDFFSATQELVESNQQFDIILADLGVSSPHLNEGSRGFAINISGPLDMRMDQTQELTAETIVNDYREADLAEILKNFGEEPKSKQIAKAIVEARPLETTTQLAEIVKTVWKGYSKIHPATRTFQAIRIAVNDEMGMLERSLPLWLELLKPGGRIAIISFHSLEDRLVKKAFSENSGNNYDSSLVLITKHPIKASAQEIALNPRARSAKLRAAAKIKKKGN